MVSNSPIRVGIIGLSTSAKTSWASSAHLPYLKDCKGKYIITALCNTSVTSAKTAIDSYGLPSTTKAFGDAKDLAADPDVDLVVCCTRVDTHYETIKPAIEQGKAVFVEWPLGSNLKQAQELNELTRQKNVESMVGLQGRLSPIVLKVKSLVEDGRIGKVLSTNVVADGGTASRDSLKEGLKYFTQKEVGGNIVTIGFGHMIDNITHVLGKFSSFHTQLGIQRPKVDILSPSNTVLETVTNNVPDHILLHGVLTSGALASVHFRRGQAFRNSPGFIWRIHGSLGEIKVTASGPAVSVGDPVTVIEVDDFEKETVETVEWKWADELPVMARNVGRLYEAFAKGEGYPDFGDAVKGHQFLEDVLRDSK
ncbi:MAG: hypothetical protein M1835_005858 [Candelina submexicana]|nr:MAG: hypothetical protein M1835_005858 [Candelina submexicana]